MEALESPSHYVLPEFLIDRLCGPNERLFNCHQGCPYTCNNWNVSTDLHLVSFSRVTGRFLKTGLRDSHEVPGITSFFSEKTGKIGINCPSLNTYPVIINPSKIISKKKR